MDSEALYRALVAYGTVMRSNNNDTASLFAQTARETGMFVSITSKSLEPRLTRLLAEIM